ncbi:MAG: DNA replication and repair protein RecF [Muribaculaceae bacterium]|nr:DNA replication and repair protein RecF [Muribaculaceae bacterium]
MTLDNIEILNFKNIPNAKLEFSPGVNCLLGMNGMGKSNLLDAIHLLSMARPMTSLPDSSLLKHGEELMLVKGEFHTDADAKDTISCGLAKGKRKSLKRNGKEYSKFSEHIGNYPIVISTPDDSRIVSGSGEERRKLMDMVISQADPTYLASLIKYNRALENRNKMLRAGVKDPILYESIENTMEETGTVIHNARKDWVEAIGPIIAEIYERISGGNEKTDIKYKSKLNDSTMKEVLEANRAKDQVLGFTSAGVHRDDLESSLDGYSLRALGSQGQLKTFAVALRLAIYRYLKRQKGVTPLLLLDDIFDKLDASRVENIMKEVTNTEEFGQIFITDTNRKHLDDILSGINGPKTLIHVSQGEFTPITLE